MSGRVLIVAGSDSGGGAGIQADIKTVTALGGYAATALTALTAQNTEGVFGIHDVPVDFIVQQMTLVLDDIGADAIKTGMLHTAGIIEAVAEVRGRLAPQTPLIVDPVMYAKGGAALLAPDALDALIEALVRTADLVTPNIPEAAHLTGLSIETVDDMRRAGAALKALGPAAVLIKGGHLPGETLTDVLVADDGERIFDSRRIDTRHTHGTGCTLASAIAAGIAQGAELAAAVERARDYVFQAILRAPGFGRGHGPLAHGHTSAWHQAKT